MLRAIAFLIGVIGTRPAFSAGALAGAAGVAATAAGSARGATSASTGATGAPVPFKAFFTSSKVKLPWRPVAATVVKSMLF